VENTSRCWPAEAQRQVHRWRVNDGLTRASIGSRSTPFELCYFVR
jgi:hypothetical protein